MKCYEVTYHEIVFIHILIVYHNRISLISLFEAVNRAEEGEIEQKFDKIE